MSQTESYSDEEEEMSFVKTKNTGFSKIRG